MTDSYTEVANLIARYAELIDGGDFDGVAELLSEAAVGAGDSTSLLKGRQAIRALFTSTTRIHPDGTPGTKHVTTNLILHIDDDDGTATARSYWTVLASGTRAAPPTHSGRSLSRSFPARGRRVALHRATVSGRPGR